MPTWQVVPTIPSLEVAATSSVLGLVCRERVAAAEVNRHICSPSPSVVTSRQATLRRVVPFPSMLIIPWTIQMKRRRPLPIVSQKTLLHPLPLCRNILCRLQTKWRTTLLSILLLLPIRIMPSLQMFPSFVSFLEEEFSAANVSWVKTEAAMVKSAIQLSFQFFAQPILAMSTCSNSKIVLQSLQRFLSAQNTSSWQRFTTLWKRTIPLTTLAS